MRTTHTATARQIGGTFSTGRALAMLSTPKQAGCVFSVFAQDLHAVLRTAS